MNNNLEFENEDPSPDSIEDNHPRTNYGEGYGGKETLEEVAHEMLVDYGIKSIGQSIGVLTVKKLMVNMAKWQSERIENESEQLINELESLVKDNNLGESYRAGIMTSIWRIKKWFEQFKKK